MEWAIWASDDPGGLQIGIGKIVLWVPLVDNGDSMNYLVVVERIGEHWVSAQKIKSAGFDHDFHGCWVAVASCRW